MIIPSSYPAQGIIYFLGHPQLITNLICPILLTIVWAIAAIIFAFAYLLQLQAHALEQAKCPAGVAWFVSVLFVLLEIALMVLLFYLIILPIYQDSLFDRVLKLRGLRHVLEKNRGNDVVKCMRGVNGGLFILVCQILVLVLTLPLNLIPVLGQILYAGINGWILTFGIRFHYDAEIRNISVAQSRREAWKRRSDYASFGSVAVALEMIPIANLVFMWTNIVGCALWVADEIEKEESRRIQQNQQQEQQQQQQQKGNKNAAIMDDGAAGSRLSSSKTSTAALITSPSSAYLEDSHLRQHHDLESSGMLSPSSSLSPPPPKSGGFKGLFGRSTTEDSKNGKSSAYLKDSHLRQHHDLESSGMLSPSSSLSPPPAKSEGFKGLFGRSTTEDSKNGKSSAYLEDSHLRQHNDLESSGMLSPSSSLSPPPAKSGGFKGLFGRSTTEDSKNGKHSV